MTILIKTLRLMAFLIKLDNLKVPRHPSFLLKIKITIMDNWNTYSTYLSLPLSHTLSFLLSLSLALSLSLPLSFCLPLSHTLSFSLSVHHLERKRERELHALASRKCGHALSIHSRKQKVQACSMHSLFSQSVGMRDYII